MLVIVCVTTLPPVFHCAFFFFFFFAAPLHTRPHLPGCYLAYGSCRYRHLAHYLLHLRLDYTYIVCRRCAGSTTTADAVHAHANTHLQRSVPGHSPTLPRFCLLLPICPRRALPFAFVYRLQLYVVVHHGSTCLPIGLRYHTTLPRSGPCRHTDGAALTYYRRRSNAFVTFNTPLVRARYTRR